MKIAPLIVAAAVLAAAVTPAAAQWERITDIPVSNVFSVVASGDTIVAGADSVTLVSINGGSTWKKSKKVVDGVHAVTSAKMHGGRLYAGTYGQGVFVSDDLGSTWTDFNEGLSGLAFFIQELVFSSNTLYAATVGDGAWSRSLSPPGQWARFGDVFEPNQASNMTGMALHGTRLVAAGGANGMVFVRDPGDTDWNISFLDNVGLHPSLTAESVFWTGSRWFIGANNGLFQSPTGNQPWLFGGPGLGALSNVSFAMRGPDLLVAFTTLIGSVFEYSHDGGTVFQIFDSLPGVIVIKLATHDNTLYAARNDGLWRRSIATVPTKPATWGGIKALYRAPKN